MLSPHARRRLQVLINDPETYDELVAELDAIPTPASNVAQVDGIDGDDATASLGGSPFQTIQAAVNSCVAANAQRYTADGLGTMPPQPPSFVFATSPMNARGGYVVDVINPYTSYDEDVTIDASGALHLMLTGEAGWDLGVFNGTATNWQPEGAPAVAPGPGVSSRSIRITGNPYVNTSGAPNLDIRPSIVITSKARAPWHGTNHLAWWGPRIAGRVLFDLPNQIGGPPGPLYSYAGNLEVVLDCEVHGNGYAEAVSCLNTTYAGVSPGNNPLLTVATNRARFRKAANFGSSATFQALHTRFDGLLTCGTWGTIALCRLVAGMTASTPTGLPPLGILNSTLAGVFTGPASAWLRMDLASNTTFVASGASIVGGGSKLLLNDATP